MLMPWRNRQPSILATLLVLLVSITAKAGTTSEVLEAFGDYLPRVRATWEFTHQAVDESPAESLRKGDIGFVAMGELVLGQDEISVTNSIDKMRKQLKESAEWNSEKRILKRLRNDARSTLRKREPIIVVRAPDRDGRPSYVVIDGHHELFAGLYLGSRTAPVEVARDYSRLTVEQFWRRMKSEHLVFLKRPASSLAQRPPSIEEVVDYPNRYLASLLALKVQVAADGEMKIKDAAVDTTAVWMKISVEAGGETKEVRATRPFMEFYIGRILEKAGINYRKEWGEEVPESVVNKARKVLAGFDVNGDNVIAADELRLIENATLEAELIESPKKLRKFLSESEPKLARSCRRIIAH